MTHTLSRRSFLKLNIVIGGATALTWLIPNPAQAMQGGLVPRKALVPTELVAIPTLLGTPTGIALSWAGHGQAWTIDSAGVVHRFNANRPGWEVDSQQNSPPISAQLHTARSMPASPASEQSRYFPQGSTLYRACWSTHSPRHQAWMVLAPG